MLQSQEFWTAVSAFIAGAFSGSLLTLRFTRSYRANGSSRIVDQSRSRVGGDQVGGSKTER